MPKETERDKGELNALGTEDGDAMANDQMVGGGDVAAKDLNGISKGNRLSCRDGDSQTHGDSRVVHVPRRVHVSAATGADGQTSWPSEWRSGQGRLAGEGSEWWGGQDIFRQNENSGAPVPRVGPPSTSGRAVRPRYRVTVVVTMMSSRMTAGGGGHGPHGSCHARDVRAAPTAVAARVWDNPVGGRPSSRRRRRRRGHARIYYYTERLECTAKT